jgi:hypothetical protein
MDFKVVDGIASGYHPGRDVEDGKDIALCGVIVGHCST